MHQRKRGHKLSLLVAMGAALAALAVFATILGSGLAGDGEWYRWWPHFSLPEVTDWIRESGPWGIAVAMGLMVLHSFVPFPAELVAIANGMVYGSVGGTLVTWTGAMMGAMLSFGLSRRFGRPLVERLLTHEAVSRIDLWLDHHGAGSLMFSRFIPVIAFNLINYAAGLTTIPWWTFIWVTGIGILPLTTLMVVMGDHIEVLPWWLWAVLACAGLLMWYATHRLAQRESPGRAG